MFPAIFLDRDGVIIENRAGYIRGWPDVEIFPEALEALALASLSPYKIIIITNQAGIGHGLIPREVADDINHQLIVEIEKVGGRIDGIYLCPHRPEDQCECRKPRPGLILQAAHELCLDLTLSILIGDALSDMQAGRSAGVGHLALVRTGRGVEQERLGLGQGLLDFPVYDNLYQAIQNLIDRPML